MKIYIIENSMMAWAWIVNVISRLNGLEIIGFTGNPEDVFNLINTRCPDLIFISDQLYHINTDLIQKIKNINRNIKIAIIGENLDPEYKDAYLELGADYYIDKIKNNKKNSDAIIRIIIYLKTKSADKNIHFRSESIDIVNNSAALAGFVPKN